jgi:flavoprotein
VKITLVKKILADGSPCQKCADVVERLHNSGQMARIDEVLVADERDPQSPGMLLAGRLQVTRAPFFLVTAETGTETVYTVYFKFAKEVLNASTSQSQQAAEILNDNPDLDFI